MPWRISSPCTGVHVQGYSLAHHCRRHFHRLPTHLLILCLPPPPYCQHSPTEKNSRYPTGQLETASASSVWNGCGTPATTSYSRSFRLTEYTPQDSDPPPLTKSPPTPPPRTKTATATALNSTTNHTMPLTDAIVCCVSIISLMSFLIAVLYYASK